MGRATAMDYVFSGYHNLTLNGRKYERGEALAPSDWLGLGIRKRQMFLSRGIVELLPRSVGRPKVAGA